MTFRKTVGARKKNRIVPLYIKNSANKTTAVYLDISTYKAVVEKIKKFEKTSV